MVHDLEKRFLYKGYHFYHNSTISSRGVAILISKHLNYNVVEIKRDPVCNILLIKIVLDGIILILGSIYGPNDENNIFCNNLGRMIRGLSNGNIIIGGDWNAT